MWLSWRPTAALEITVSAMMTAVLSWLVTLPEGIVLEKGPAASRNYENIKIKIEIEISSQFSRW